MSPILIIWTCKNREEALRVSQLLLEERMIACASMFPVESVFHWEGKIEHANEYKVLLKTVRSCFPAVKKQIIANCSYAVPEILQISIEGGNEDYLLWLNGLLAATPPL